MASDLDGTLDQIILTAVELRQTLPADNHSHATVTAKRLTIEAALRPMKAKQAIAELRVQSNLLPDCS